MSHLVRIFITTVVLVTCLHLCPAQPTTAPPPTTSAHYEALKVTYDPNLPDQGDHDPYAHPTDQDSGDHGDKGDHGDSHDNKSHHGNESEHHEIHGIHVASWNYAYVREPFIISVFLLVAAICKLGFHHADFLSSIVPESCLLVILGTVVGAILQIILESAYSLHDRVFSDNLGTVLLFAVLGTVINCFLIGPTLYGLAHVGAMGPIKIGMVQCFVFASLIVAVDPVAVLAIFQEIGVNDVLYFIVFGESLFNDAVTVVLYNMMKAFNEMPVIPPDQIALGFAAFFSVSLGGLVVGIILGCVTAFITKYTKKVRVVEPLAVFALAYISYLAAEMFHFSGIISIIGCGLVQAQYAFHNISHKSHTTIKYFSKMQSTTCDCIIFMFLGLELVRKDHVWHTGFVLWTIFLCLIYRFAVVLVLTFFANRVDRLRIIGLEEQFIMAYGGLRGAVCFSLVAMLDPLKLPPNMQQMFETTTLAVIIFTIFVQGITIKPLVRLLRITGKDEVEMGVYEEINFHVTDHVMAGIEEIMGYVGHNYIREVLDYYDNTYLKNWLQRDPQTKDDQIMEMYEKLALKQHYENLQGSAAIRERYASNLTIEAICPEEDLHADLATLSRDPELMDRAMDTTLELMRSRRASVRRQSRKLSRSDAVCLDDAPSTPPMSPTWTTPRKMPLWGRSKSAEVRRKSVFRRESTTSSINSTGSEALIENPTAKDLRKMLVTNPKKLRHKKYDKNITRDEDDDLMHHLHDKQLRTNRYKRAMSVCYTPVFSSGAGSPMPGSPMSRSPPAVSSPRLSQEKLFGPQVMNPISESEEDEEETPNSKLLGTQTDGLIRKRSLDKQNGSSTDEDKRRAPGSPKDEQDRKRKLRQLRPKLQKALTIDPSGFVDNKDKDKKGNDDKPEKEVKKDKPDFRLTIEEPDDDPPAGPSEERPRTISFTPLDQIEEETAI